MRPVCLCNGAMQSASQLSALRASHASMLASLEEAKQLAAVRERECEELRGQLDELHESAEAYRLRLDDVQPFTQQVIINVAMVCVGVVV